MKTLCVTCEDPLLLEAYQNSGADEVILAMQEGCFSPLHAFAKDEILAMIPRIHALGMQAGILMNRLFHEDDVMAAETAMEEFVLHGADSIIFADTALARHALKCGFMNRMVYQPETMMTSSYDAKVWSETGLKTLMISSLLTKAEVSAIASSVTCAGINIHGYQLMSVSARPLLTAYAEQTGLPPLREKDGLYLQEEKRNGMMPVYESAYAAMIFSDYIQESFDELPAFIAAGAERFVIDSWHLDTECITDTVSLYRSILDQKADAEDISAYREKYQKLPLSTGYYEQKTVR